MRRASQRALLVGLALAVTAVFTYYAVRDVHPGEVWEALRESNAWWLLPSFATLAAMVVVRALRWQYLFVPETRPAFGPVLSAMLVGLMFNNILPLRAGEAARVVALNQRAGTSRAETIATVAIERVLDVLCLLFLLFVALPWLPDVDWVGGAVTLAAVLTALLLAAVAVLWRYGERPVHALAVRLGRLRFVPAEAMEGAALNLVRGLAALRRPHLAVAAVFWTTFSWVLASFSFWLAMLAFNFDLSPVAGLLVLAAAGLAMILPAAPASIGVFEAATLVALGAYGIGESRALSYALVLHGLNFFPYVVAGVIALRYTRRS